MKTITKQYSGISGYNDVSPGITSVSVCHASTEDGVTIFKHSSDVPAEFNEVQISGDKTLRIECLPPSERDTTNILFLDDPDYKKKFLLRSFICSKDLPIHLSDAFIRAWVAMSIGVNTWLDSGSLIAHPVPVDDISINEWGGVDGLSFKKEILNSISNIPDLIRDELMLIESNPQFIADYLYWRDSLPDGTRIEYKENNT